jgi:hypothetical protein
MYWLPRSPITAASIRSNPLAKGEATGWVVEMSGRAAERAHPLEETAPSLADTSVHLLGLVWICLQDDFGRLPCGFIAPRYDAPNIEGLLFRQGSSHRP